MLSVGFVVHFYNLDSLNYSYSQNIEWSESWLGLKVFNQVPHGSEQLLKSKTVTGGDINMSHVTVINLNQISPN